MAGLGAGTVRRLRALAAASVAAGVLAFAFGACRGIAGLRSLAYAPPETGCGPAGLPRTGNGRIRFVNAGTDGAAADVCLRASGTSDWGAPLLANARGGCTPGIDYATATVAFPVPAGTYDVEAVPAGRACGEAAATSSASGVFVGDASAQAPVVTLVRMAGGATHDERLVALPEAGPARPDSYLTRIRLVNALAGTTSIMMGAASSSSLPATLTTIGLATPVPPGGVEPSGPVPLAPTEGVDGAGYIGLGASGSVLGVALDGSTNALFVVPTPATEDTQSLFAIGDATDAAHPPRGLTCEDAPPADDAGGPGGGVLAACQLSALPTLAVDTFCAGLFGAGADYQAQRRQPVYDAIAARTTDLMCVTDADAFLDQQGIAKAAAAHFPYAYYLDPPANLDTKPDDPATLDGGVPPAPTDPPCSASIADQVAALTQCVAQHCTPDGDPNEMIDTTSCLLPNCGGQAAGIQQASPACFDCMVLQAVSGPVATAQSVCNADPRTPFTFRGATTPMMLSKYPLANQQRLVLPSSGWRRSVLYATVKLEDQSIDFYCAELSSPKIDGQLPYVGAYGRDGRLPDGGIENGWEDEQNLQVAQVVAFIQKTSGASGNPAVIAGQWQSSKQVIDPGTGKTVVGDVAPEVMDRLLAAFTEARPPAPFVPPCTYCPAPANPYNGAGVPERRLTTLLLGFPDGATTEDSNWGTDFIPIPTQGDDHLLDGGPGPLSPEFPHVVRVGRPRPR